MPAPRCSAALLSPRALLWQALSGVERGRLDAGQFDVADSLRAWQGLLAGRWWLADHWDPEGPASAAEVVRFVLALPADRAPPARRGLTPQEQQGAELLGRGQSTKDIAFARGISLAAVSAQLSSAGQKLGLRSRTELAAFFSPSGARTRLVATAVAGERLLIGAYPVCRPRSLARLTRAEHAVATLLLRGASNQTIADRRRTSPRTIANQVQAIFRKLRVQSRVELATALQGAG